jgi:hypothetical protein
MRNEYKILGEKPEYFKDLVIDGRITLEWILEKQDGNVWPGFI